MADKKPGVIKTIEGFLGLVPRSPKSPIPLSEKSASLSASAVKEEEKDLPTEKKETKVKFSTVQIYEYDSEKMPLANEAALQISVRDISGDKKLARQERSRALLIGKFDSPEEMKE